ncbi:hypothetical protein BRADI_2g08435v3 [Brachypodium distachyon]|uniref:DUF4283 domain-containing protein n=1 Tax=Brachypodium distachyon TaxID=15368 RepID=A0A0Q3MGF6_BRADI|nr:hypothetical protein BRADI_2g08435v3 [Brachypodium distachyon]
MDRGNLLQALWLSPAAMALLFDAILSNSDAAALTASCRERGGTAFADKECTSHQRVDLHPSSTAAAQIRRLEDMELASSLLNVRFFRRDQRYLDHPDHHQQPVAGSDEVFRCTSCPLPRPIQLVLAVAPQFRSRCLELINAPRSSRSYGDAVALGGPCDAHALLGKAHSAPSSPRSAVAHAAWFFPPPQWRLIPEPRPSCLLKAIQGTLFPLPQYQPSPCRLPRPTSLHQVLGLGPSSEAIEAKLGTPPHSLRVTRHHPEAFFIHFDFPAHRDRAIALGRLVVNDSAFILQPWRELDHGSIERHDLHVRVVIEKMPLHLWSIEGAEQVFVKDVIMDRLDSRTYAKEDTRLFSCWVWCQSLDRIPSDHAFIVFRGGAGRVKEMHGFSPPRRQIAALPEGIRFNAIIHIDLVEDWTVRSSEEAVPCPAIQLYSWFEGLYDGDVPAGNRRQIPGSCRDAFTLAPRRDDTGDDDDLQCRPGRNSGTARAQPPRIDATPSGLGGSCHRSRTPSSHHRWAASLPHLLASDVPLLPPPLLPLDGPLPQRLVDLLAPVPMLVSSPVHAPAPAPPASPVTPSGQRSTSSEDPLAELIASERLSDIDWSPQDFDPMALELDAFCTKVAPPRCCSRLPPPAAGPALDRSAPHRSGPSRLVSLCRTDVATHSDATDGILQSLFAQPPASVLGASPPLSSPIAKEKPAATPRRSARQAGRASSTPVAQRATIRLAKELAVIKPGDQHADVAASALVQRFKEPLSDVDIDGLAVLTRIDRDALLRVAAQASASRAATQVH